MTHNVHDEEVEKNLTKLPNYLLKLEKYESALGRCVEEIIPCNYLTSAIRIATEEGAICTLYETISTKNRTAQYLCDISYGVC